MDEISYNIEDLVQRYPCLNSCKYEIMAAYEKIIGCYLSDGKLLLCGNGGSSADCSHIASELMKGFLKRRPLCSELKDKLINNYDDNGKVLAEKLQGSLPAISLTSHISVITAFMNDVDPDLIFAQQVYGYGRKGDLLVCLSTSGNSKNVLYAAYIAKEIGIDVIGMTGKSGGKLKQAADINICVPETETFKVQELHLPIYHFICAAVEQYFYSA